ncbi:MAG TPA: hypothetical protein VGB92_12670 [Longimicrobium sp.]|jgi:hypothetical protein
MRVRTFGLSILALGILIGGGGCTAESPTSPLAPATAAANKGGVPNHTAGDSTVTVQGGYLSGGGRRPDGGSTVQAAGGFLSGGG